jgi:hypothetical protein
VLDGTAHMPAGIAILQSPHENRIQYCSGYDAELTAQCHRAREDPVGHTNSHSTLNDGRKREACACSSHRPGTYWPAGHRFSRGKLEKS